MSDKITMKVDDFQRYRLIIAALHATAKRVLENAEIVHESGMAYIAGEDMKLLREAVRNVEACKEMPHATAG